MTLNAVGGLGGDRTLSSGIGGNGGHATAHGVGVNNSGSVSVFTVATGGRGFSGGAAGNGTAHSFARSVTRASANAEAYAGTSGDGARNASATARAETLGVGTPASANAKANGATGQTIAAARAEGAGKVHSAAATAQAPVNGLTEVSAAAVLGGLASANSSANAYAQVAGLPTATSVAAALAGNPNSAGALPGSGASDYLAHGTLGLKSLGSVATHSWNASAVIDLSVVYLAHNQLILSVFNPASSLPSFESLTFSARGGGVSYSRSFANRTDALAFFQDNPISLGRASRGSIVRLELDMVTAAPNVAFETSFLLGTTGGFTAGSRLTEPDFRAHAVARRLGRSIRPQRRVWHRHRRDR